MSLATLNIESISGNTLGGKKLLEDFLDAASNDVDLNFLCYEEMPSHKISRQERMAKKELGININNKFQMDM